MDRGRFSTQQLPILVKTHVSRVGGTINAEVLIIDTNQYHGLGEEEITKKFYAIYFDKIQTFKSNPPACKY